METAALISALTPMGPLPREALRQASQAKQDLTPVFIQEIEAYIANPNAKTVGNSIFFMVHLLAQWRATATYPTLVKLLRCPHVEDALGWDTVTENGVRLVASVFEGDPDPLFALIHDAQVDQFTRAVMLKALAVVTARGMLDRETARAFLRSCWDELEPHSEDYVWVGWVEAVAALGFAEMTPLAEEAFAKGLVDPSVIELRHFHRDLAEALRDPDRTAWLAEHHNSFFGDVVDELARWHCFSEEYLAKCAHAENGAAPLPDLWDTIEPRTNPFRDIGRNDPCPCGSGKKFKKCCLN